MSGGSKKTETQQQTTQSNQIDPWSKALLEGNLASAQANAARIDTPYSGPLTAGFTPTQLQAQGVLSGIATDPRYQAANNNAIGTINGVLGSSLNPNVTSTAITPHAMQAATIGAPQQVRAGALAETDLAPYMNPFTQNVIDTSLSDLERARQIQRVNDQQSATKANAFGGSRSGVADSLTNDAYLRNAASTAANLRSQGFLNAQGAAVGDIDRRFAADQFNTTAGLNASQFNAANEQAARQANMNADYNAQQFNSTAATTAQQASINNELAKYGLQLNAAGQLVSTANNALATSLTQAGVLGAVGDAQQQQQQQEINAKYQEFLRQQNIPIAQQQLLNSALGLIPVQQTVSGSSNGTSVEKTSGGLGGVLGGIASIGLGLGSLGTGSIAGSLLGLGKSAGGGLIGQSTGPEFGWT